MIGQLLVRTVADGHDEVGNLDVVEQLGPRLREIEPFPPCRGDRAGVERAAGCVPADDAGAPARRSQIAAASWLRAEF